MLQGSSTLLCSMRCATVSFTLHRFKAMDKHDLMILDIVQQHKREQQEHIRLATLERNFWKRIEGDVTLSVGQARIGERITRLYLDGLIQNKSGYMLTKKGREALNVKTDSFAHLA
jgi:hypothetical protein